MHSSESKMYSDPLKSSDFVVFNHVLSRRNLTQGVCMDQRFEIS